jgi:cytochrome b561
MGLKMTASESGLTITAEKTVDRSKYTRVAIILHWAIAGLIIFNLAIGFVMEGFPLPVRFVALVLHVSSGMTVLVLTVFRIAWRLMHEPPAYFASMKLWERRLSHAIHLFLYVAMVVMPLTGWAIVSAHPRPGSDGAAEQARHLPFQIPGAPPSGVGAPQSLPATPPAGLGVPPAGLAAPPGAPAMGGPAGPPAGAPPRRQLKVWWLFSLPSIKVIEDIGETTGGYAPQQALHEEFVSWHSVGGYIMLLLLALHIAGALKHQYLDKEPELERMGLGRRKGNA